MHGVQGESLAFSRISACVRPSSRVAGSLWTALRVGHALFALVMLWACLVRFIMTDSFLEGGRDHDIYPRDLFSFVNQLTYDTVNRDIQRVMNVPFVCTVLGYVAGCLYFHFKGHAWLLTAATLPIYIVYFSVQQRWSDSLDWKYFSSRGLSIFLQVLALVISLTVTVVAVQWKRERLRFSLKSWWNIRDNGPCHVGWNLLGHFILLFTAFTIWFSRLYSSYICVLKQSEVYFLCQFTSQVQCFYCNSCTFDALKQCVSKVNHSSVQCSSVVNVVDQDQGAVCLFNYNVGYYSVVITFAYIGGIFFFLRNFLNAVVHYILVTSHSVVVFWLNYSGCFCLPKGMEGRMRHRLALVSHLNTDEFHMVESRDLRSSGRTLSSHRYNSFGTFSVGNEMSDSDSDANKDDQIHDNQRTSHQTTMLMNSV